MIMLIIKNRGESAIKVVECLVDAEKVAELKTKMLTDLFVSF
ncbi:hypothetical protein [Halanaerocella petrolearia]